MEKEKIYLKEFFKQQACLAYISSFYHEDGYCHLKREDFAKFLNIKKIDDTSNMIKKLSNSGAISNETIQGYCLRIKLLNKNQGCPDFILRNDLPFYVRGFLYCIKDCEIPNRKVDQIKVYSKFFNIEKKKLERVLYDTNSSLNIGDILSSYKNIEFDFKNLNDRFVYTKYGFYYKNSVKEFHCNYCGSLLNRFNSRHISYMCCDECTDLLKIDLDALSNILYNRSKKNSLNYSFEYNLTTEYIKFILTNQGLKCAYSGLNFDLFDLNALPTIDRIDSSKGYITGNIVIARNDINKMKSNYSLDHFKMLVNSVSKKIGGTEGVCL